MDSYRCSRSACDAEIDLFQGAFFQTPAISPETVDGDRDTGRLRLIAAMLDRRAEFEQLDDMISTNMGISYRLLRLINSAYFALPQPVGSVHDAIVMLGRRTCARGRC